MAEQIALEQIDDFRTIFDEHAEDGKVSIEKLGEIMRLWNQNPTTDELNELTEKFTQSDADGNGMLDFDEFLNLVSEKIKSPEEITQDFLGAFKVFDKDDSGGLDMEELRAVLTQFGEDKFSDEQVAQLFQDLDTDLDGKLNYKEFVKLMTGQVSFPE